MYIWFGVLSGLSSKISGDAVCLAPFGDNHQKLRSSESPSYFCEWHPRIFGISETDCCKQARKWLVPWPLVQQGQRRIVLHMLTTKNGMAEVILHVHKKQRSVQSQNQNMIIQWEEGHLQWHRHVLVNRFDTCQRLNTPHQGQNHSAVNAVPRPLWW